MHSFEREIYYELSNFVPQLKKYLFINLLRTLLQTTFYNGWKGFYWTKQYTYMFKIYVI